MTFVVDYTGKRKRGGSVENFVVDHLMKAAHISATKKVYGQSVYDLVQAEFNGSEAVVSIKPNQELNLRLSRGGGSIARGIPTYEKGRYTFSFSLSPDHSIQFNNKTLFHDFLNGNMGGYGFSEGDFTLPKKAEISLQYHDVPFGIWHALPKNILENLTSFSMNTRISGQGQQYSISWSSGDREESDSETIGAGYHGGGSKNEQKARKVFKALKDTEFLKLGREKKEPWEIRTSRFFNVDGEMNYSRALELERVLAEVGGTQNDYRVEGNFTFSGEVNTGALQGVPKILDGEGFSSGLAILREDSYIKYPNFSVRPKDGYPPGTIVTVNPGNLEQAAALSNMFHEQYVNISVEKQDQRRRVA